MNSGISGCIVAFAIYAVKFFDKVPSNFSVVVDCICQATGTRLGMVMQSLSSILTGIVIAFIYSWELALFILGLAPAFILAGLLEMKMYAGFASSEELEGAGQVGIMILLCSTLSSCVALYWLNFSNFVHGFSLFTSTKICHNLLVVSP